MKTLTNLYLSVCEHVFQYMKYTGFVCEHAFLINSEENYNFVRTIRTRYFISELISCSGGLHNFSDNRNRTFSFNHIQRVIINHMNNWVPPVLRLCFSTRYDTGPLLGLSCVIERSYITIISVIWDFSWFSLQHKVMGRTYGEKKFPIKLSGDQLLYVKTLNITTLHM